MRKILNLGGVILIAATFSACGGSKDAKVADNSKSTASTTAKPTTTTEPKHPQRPEGDWAVMRWEAEHGGEGGYASVTQVLYRLTPTCKSGPCDLEVTGAGLDGSAYLTEMPSRDGAPDPGPMTGFTMSWNATDETYSYSNTEPSQCFAEGGAVVEHGYDLKTTGVLKFTAGSDSSAAAMHGTREMVATATPEGAAAGCETFSEKFVMAASPLGAFVENPPSLAGEYWASMWIAEIAPPDANRPKGVILTFNNPVTFIGEDSSYILGSWFGAPAALAPSGDGIWSGSATSNTDTCTESSIGGEYDSSQKWENPQIVTLTASGKPVISANYSWVAEPSPAGVAKGCERAVERGLAFLVPKEAA